VPQRLRRAAEGLAPGVLVYVLWSAMVRHAGMAVRIVHLDHEPLATVRRFVGAASSFLAPSYLGEGPIATAGRVGLKGALIVGVIALAVRVGRSGAPRVASATLSVAAGVLAAGVGALLLVARLLESSVAFYDRMLSPVHALLAVAIVAAVAAWWPLATRAARAAAVVLGVAWLVTSGGASARLVAEARTHGLDHTHIGAETSPMWAWVRDSAVGPIYTNDPADVYFQTGRPSRSLPWVMTQDSVRALCGALSRRPGPIVWVKDYTANGLVYPELVRVAATLARVEQSVPVHAVARFPDGVVWLPDSSLAGDPRCAVQSSLPPR
jgi:hypothetical protein